MLNFGPMTTTVDSSDANLAETIADVELHIETVRQQLDALTRQRDALLACHDLVEGKPSPSEASQVKRSIASKRALVVGAKGEMGRLFSSLLKGRMHSVLEVDAGHWPISDADCRLLDLVILCVPMDQIGPVCTNLPTLPENCILADVSSAKTRPLAEMLASHRGPVVGLHPMFGGDIKSLAQQTIVVCPGRMVTSDSWFLTLLDNMQADLVYSDAKTHDEMMAIVQALRHFTTFTYGAFLREKDVDLELLLAFSSPIYRMELMMVGRLFAQNPKLYSNIIYESENNKQVIRDYSAFFARSIRLLENDDQKDFLGSFKAISEWMGDISKDFQAESSQLIKQSQAFTAATREEDEEESKRR